MGAETSLVMPKRCRLLLYLFASGCGQPQPFHACAVDANAAKPRRNYKEDSDTGPSESDEEEQDPFAAGNDDDPTIVDNQGQSGFKGWALNQRSKWGTCCKGSYRLPQDAAKRLSRR